MWQSSVSRIPVLEYLSQTTRSFDYHTFFVNLNWNNIDSKRPSLSKDVTKHKGLTEHARPLFHGMQPLIPGVNQELKDL